MKLPVIVLGGGGHAKVVIDVLLAQGRRVLGYCDLEPRGEAVLGVARLGNEEQVFQFAPTEVELVNGIGSIRPGPTRHQVYERFAGRGFVFARTVHPSAVVAAGTELGDGVQIMARAVVQPGSRIGSNTILNTAVSVDHDCHLGRHVHIAPGAVLCGHVRVGDGAHVGAGATVIQGISIGAGSMVGAGAVVLNDVAPDATVVGVPARPATSSSVRLKEAPKKL